MNRQHSIVAVNRVHNILKPFNKIRKGERKKSSLKLSFAFAQNFQTKEEKRKEINAR